jgi:hypothetical protein
MQSTRWLSGIILAGLMTFGGNSMAAEPGTGPWLLESCKGDYGDPGKAFCLGYTMGLADLMLGQQRICMAPDVTSEQMRLTVSDFLTRHPEKLAQLPVVLVIEALTTAYPCSR